MRWEVRIGDRTRAVELRREGRSYAVKVDGSSYRIDAVRTAAAFSSLLVDSASFDLGVSAKGNRYTVDVDGKRFCFDLLDQSIRWIGSGSPGASVAGPRQVVAIMPGRVVSVLVKEGQKVKAGEGLVILEAMKMDNEMQSPKGGTVTRVHVAPGQIVEAGEPIITVR